MKAILSLNDIHHLSGVSRTQLSQLAARKRRGKACGGFPEPVEKDVDGHGTGWSRSDVEVWMHDRASRGFVGAPGTNREKQKECLQKINKGNSMEYAKSTKVDSLRELSALAEKAAKLLAVVEDADDETVFKLERRPPGGVGAGVSVMINSHMAKSIVELLRNDMSAELQRVSGSVSASLAAMRGASGE